jgi:3-oxoacyl-[acyl-carrier protein] reductase
VDLGLAEKIALVTASSRGLGKAVALCLAREGAHVAVCARHEEDLTAAADEIREATGQRVVAIAADVAEPESAAALVDATMETFGRLDILVTNAGGPPPGTFLDLSAGDWEQAVQLTLMSAVRLCYAAAPAMKRQSSGAILAMTSLTVKQPLPNLILSNSLRLGVTGLIKTLADELGPYGIRVNALCPGWTRTERVDQLLEDRARRNDSSVEHEAARLAADIPLGRMGTPAEFAATAAFLVSDRASYINGVSLLVDGGMHRGVM